MPRVSHETHEGVQGRLDAMACALERQRYAYQHFLLCAQAFEWEAAEVYRVQVSALQDVVCDSFMAACRLMEEG